MTKSISVLIPVYKTGNLLKKCIESVLKQSIKPNEILIFDDCPVSPMDYIIKEFDSPLIRYQINIVNLGRTKNYYKLLNEAASEYVIILDGDDQFCNVDFIKDAKEAFRTYPGIIMFSGGCKNQYENYSIKRYLTQSSKVFGGYEYLKKWISAKQTPPHSSSVFHRNTALKLNCYTKDVINTDIISQRLLLIHGDIFVSDKIYSTWNFTGNNSSSITDLFDFVENYNTVYLPYKKAKMKHGTSISLFIWYFRATFKYYTSVTNLLLNSSWKKIPLFYWMMFEKYFIKS